MSTHFSVVFFKCLNELLSEKQFSQLILGRHHIKRDVDLPNIALLMQWNFLQNIKGFLFFSIYTKIKHFDGDSADKIIYNSAKRNTKSGKNPAFAICKTQTQILPFI